MAAAAAAGLHARGGDQLCPFKLSCIGQLKDVYVQQMSKTLQQ
jgi:hypothetical protein